jgi:hypothetical protein
MSRAIASVILLVLFAAYAPAFGAERPLVDEYLVTGRLAEGHARLVAHLEQHPDDAQARYSQGVVEILQAVERLGQSLHTYGLRSQSPKLPFVRLPVPQNPEPKKITYEAFRGIFQQLIDDLSRAEQTLAKVEADDVKLPVRVGLVRLDLNGDAQASDDETFWRVFTAVAWRAAKLDNEQQEFRIGFDKADVHWMIGYTHLLRSLAEIYLAHDTRQFFQAAAPAFFAGVQSQYAQLGTGDNVGGFEIDAIADLILAIHLFHFEPVEPERMRQAHGHLLSMIGQSRKCWEHAVRETDDDREWIPNAQQTSLTPLVVNEQQVQSWRRFLDESEAILKGEKLVPHWRIRGPQGINVRKVFYEPRTMDLVMWVHGVGTLPYLENGPRTDPQTWQQLSAAFQGRFLAFAVWFQ